MIITAILGTNLSYALSNGKTCIQTCKSDKQRFKQLTTGEEKVCVVGQNTFVNDFNERVLPGRTFYVMQREDFVTSTVELLQKIQQLHPNCKELLVIGGVSTYNKFAEVVDRVDVSIVFNWYASASCLTIHDLHEVYQNNIEQIVVNLLQRKPPQKLVDRGWLYDSAQGSCLGVYNVVAVGRNHASH